MITKVNTQLRCKLPSRQKRNQLDYSFHKLVKRKQTLSWTHRPAKIILFLNNLSLNNCMPCSNHSIILHCLSILSCLPTILSCTWLLFSLLTILFSLALYCPLSQVLLGAAWKGGKNNRLGLGKNPNGESDLCMARVFALNLLSLIVFTCQHALSHHIVMKHRRKYMQTM